ncbi:hypothetical protein DFQ27_003216 [Actinomortierella ambigua]|uniref:Uncharacterized protein n=1 Tax=Actinomortierella ambigua TaxID=1343610 RepID=A0A9P6Q6G9_9FUNG|nr:hypothetical protein DFQ27_003216 [Actinomortierella ambigua]
MAHKRSFHQREDAPWLRYPERQVSFSRSNNTSSNTSNNASLQPSLTAKTLHDHHRNPNRHHSLAHSQHPHHNNNHHNNNNNSNENSHRRRHSPRHDHDMHQHHDRTRSSTSLTSSSSYTSTGSAGSSSRSTVSSTPPPFARKSTSSSAAAAAAAAAGDSKPRSLSEELAMALQGSPSSPSVETEISSPPSSIASPTELMSSPQDIPSTLALSHFPLLKTRHGSSSSSSSTTSSGKSSRPRPSPLSLNNSNSTRTATFGSPVQGSNPTNAHDAAVSPVLAASAAMTSTSPAGLDGTTPLVRRSTGSANGSRRASQSTTGSTLSSPRTASPSCSAHCSHQTQSMTHSHHHPHCPQHHLDPSSLSLSSSSSRHSSSISLDRSNHRQHQHHHYHLPSCQYYDPTKAERPTRGVSRLGIPRMSFFTPSVASSEPASPTTRSESPVPLARGLSGSNSDYGLSAFKAREGLVSDDDNADDGENNNDDDKEQVGGQLRLYTSEPESKKRRSRASMLLDVAVESIFFTGAFALAAYNLVTGKGRLTPDSGNSTDHSRGASQTEVADAVNEMAFDTPASRMTTTTSPRTVRTSHSHHHRSATTGPSTRYHKVRTPRSQKTRQHHHHHRSPHAHRPKQHPLEVDGVEVNHHSHSQPMSMPTRPGPEERDEQFLRMEAQISSLIDEGKRALNSRIDVWDE